MHRSAFRIVIALVLVFGLAAPAAHAAPQGAASTFEHGVRGVWQALAGWLSDLATWQPPLSAPEGCTKEGPGEDPLGLTGALPQPAPDSPACGAADCTDHGPEWDPQG